MGTLNTSPCNIQKLINCFESQPSLSTQPLSYTNVRLWSTVRLPQKFSTTTCFRERFSHSCHHTIRFTQTSYSQVLLEESEVSFSYVTIMLVGYARVSTTEQVLDLQTSEMCFPKWVKCPEQKKRQCSDNFQLELSLHNAFSDSSQSKRQDLPISC